MSAGQRVRERRATRRELPVGPARAPVTDIFLWSRAGIWAAALLALFWFEPNRHTLAARYDDPSLTHDLGAVTDVWARWDSVWFLRIAEHGYSAVGEPAAAFFPLYPWLVGGAGRAFAGHFVLAGIVVSLAGAWLSFHLLFNLAEERLGAEGARRAVLYLALFPMGLFLQAVYSESLFLACSLAAFVLAQRRRFAYAGLATGLALLTRATGFALLPSLAILAWRAPSRARAFGGLALAPAVFALYPLVLWRRFGDPWLFSHAQDNWHRHLSHLGPLGGLRDGLRAGWAGVEQLVSGSTTHLYWNVVRDQSPQHVAVVNLGALAFLALYVFLTGVVWRRFGAVYGLYATLSIALPLSMPSERWPLLSMPRFGLAVFPFFLALASLGGRPRVHTAIAGLSAVGLGVAIVQWSLWQWVS